MDHAKTAPNDPLAVGLLGSYYLLSDCPLEAVTCLTRATELDGKSIRWWYFLGVARERGYDAAGAAKAFERVVALDDSYGSAFVRLGDAILRSEPERAKTMYMRATELIPNDPRAYFGLGKCAEALGESAAAMAHYQRAIELSPKFAAALGAIAQLLTATGQESDAMAYRKRSEEGAGPSPLEDPLFIRLMNLGSKPDSPITKAQNLATAGHFDEAVSLLQEAIRETPSWLEARHTLGVVHAMQGRFAEAAKQFREVLAMNPDDIKANKRLVTALSNLGELPAALAACRKVLELRPDDVITIETQGVLLLRMGRADEAVSTFRELVSAHPQVPASHFDLATAYVMGKRFDDAVAEYKRGRDLPDVGDEALISFVKTLIMVMALQEKDAATGSGESGRMQPREMVLLADRFAEAGMTTEADAFRNYTAFITAEVTALARERKFDRAIELLDEMMPVDMGGVLRSALGGVYAISGNFDEAIKHFRLALAVDPDLLPAKSGLGYCLGEMGQYEEGEKLLQQVLEQNPTDLDTLRSLGVLKLRQLHFDESASLFERAVEARPSDAHLRYQLGEVLARAGKADDAIEHLRQALKLAPDHAGAHFMLGTLLKQRGHDDDAKRHWEQAIKADPKFARAHLALVYDLMRQKDYKAAIDQLRTGLEHTPSSPLLANAIAWILATCPDDAIRGGEEAVRRAETACAVTGRRNFEFLDTLAAAYAEAGRFDDAVKTQREAIIVATNVGQTDGIEAYKNRLALYEAGKPYRETN